jgi:uncharacterized membrane protein YesL
MSKHIFSRRGAAKAFLFFTLGVIVVGAAPAIARIAELIESRTERGGS